MVEEAQEERSQEVDVNEEKVLVDSGEDPFARKAGSSHEDGNRSLKRKRNEDEDQSANKTKKRSWRSQQETTIYMNQLPYDVEEKEIKKFVASQSKVKWAEIEGVRMVRNKEKGFKGICFVVLATKDAFKRALELDKKIFRGRKVNAMECLSRDVALAQRKQKQAEKAKKGAELAPGTEEPEAKLPKLKNQSKGGVTKDIDILIDRARKPRRTKKKDTGARMHVAGHSWRDFSAECRERMESLRVPILKRNLREFYKSDLEKIADKNAFFLKILESS